MNSYYLVPTLFSCPTIFAMKKIVVDFSKHFYPLDFICCHLSNFQINTITLAKQTGLWGQLCLGEVQIVWCACILNHMNVSCNVWNSGIRKFQLCFWIFIGIKCFLKVFTQIPYLDKFYLYLPGGGGTIINSNILNSYTYWLLTCLSVDKTDSWCHMKCGYIRTKHAQQTCRSALPSLK